jgi:hypothetical protein
LAVAVEVSAKAGDAPDTTKALTSPAVQANWMTDRRSRVLILLLPLPVLILRYDMRAPADAPSGY